MMNFKVLLILATVLHAGTGEAACRSPAVKHKFDVLSGYPHGRPGYIVDHVCSLFNGGLDDPKNMQYQSIIESKKKDRIENTPQGRKLFCTPANSTLKRTVFNCK